MSYGAVMAMERRILDVDGHSVGWYDTGETDGPVVLWHHGTPNIGEPPEPLFALADELGVRFLGLDRPGYGGSDDVGTRSVSDVAALAAAVADAAGVERFAVMGQSGGGPHALACASLLPARVFAAVSIAGLAPLVTPEGDPSGLGDDWWEGMYGVGVDELAAALKGGEALEELLAADEWDPEMFTPRDHEVLQGDWKWFQRIAAAGTEKGIGGLVADDLAYVAPWGFSVTDIRVPALVVQGGEDRVVPAQHGGWLAKTIPAAELWERHEDGHLSVMESSFDALRWIADIAEG